MKRQKGGQEPRHIIFIPDNFLNVDLIFSLHYNYSILHTNIAIVLIVC